MPNKSPTYRTSLPFKLLKTFTNEELKSFSKLISSGYLTTKQNLVKLLKSLKKNALYNTDFTTAIQCVIYNDLFEEDETAELLNDKQRKRLSKAMNELLHAAEKFLMFERIKETYDHNPTLLFPELINRKQLLLYSRRIKATEKKLDDQKRRGIEYYKQCKNIQHERVRLQFINNILVKEDNYDELQFHIDIKYLLEKLQYHLAKVTLQRRYAHKVFNLNSFKAIQTMLDFPEYKSNPLVQMYILNIQLVESEKETTYLALSKLLEEKRDFIPSDFLNIFYVNLTNYCTTQIAKGDLTYYKYLFEIYNNMDLANILVSHKSIELALLKNIITIACRVRAFNWANEKLDKYIKFVPLAIRQSVFEYHKGILAFNQEKYEVALAHFMEVKKIDNNHELSLKIVQLQCFYESDAEYKTETQQMIDSLKTYIHQNKRLSKRQKSAYFNFISVFNKLYKYKDIPGKRNRNFVLKKALPKTKQQLQKFDLISSKQWLLSKIEILESSL